MFAGKFASYFLERRPHDSRLVSHGLAFTSYQNRIGSLQRYLEYVHRYIFSYLEEGEQEYKELSHTDRLETEFGDLISNDREFLPEILYGSVLSHGYAALETLLSEVAKEIGAIKGVSISNSGKRTPYVNKYLDFLSKNCELKFIVDSKTLEDLDIIRSTRNQYTHSLNLDLFHKTEFEIISKHSEVTKKIVELDYEFIDSTLKTLSKIANIIQESYWKEILNYLERDLQ